MKTNKLLSIMLIIFLALSVILSGCGTSNKKNNNTTTPNASSNSTNKETVLKVWAMGEEGKILPQIVKKFEEQNPGIKVEVQAIPWDVAYDKLLTAVASQSGPDLTQLGTTWTTQFASSGALLDLKPYFDKYPELKPENYYEGSVKTVEYNGQIVGVPWYVDTRVLFYRTDILKEIGYDHAPKTWTELKDAADKLAKRGKGKYGIAFAPNDQLMVYMLTWQAGGRLIDDNGNPQFNSPEFIKAVNYYKSFFIDGDAPLTADQGLDLFTAFKEGIEPMFVSGPWMVSLINKQLPDLKGKWATAVLPADKTNTSFVGGCDLSVFKFSKNKDAAIKFIAFMSKPENQIEWFNLSSDLPASKQAWNDSKLKDDPILATFGEQLNNAQSTPLVKNWAAVEKATSEALEKIIVGKQDVKSTLDKLNEDVKSILSK
ncbi:ABC transporter substrate-binding protein [Thermoanaerobacter sp. YS13]|uniref:sugar ABC transporter substrate-binding protein n=1 Tax=Thermoanaerobacter sp. YS13 TaxID=1511746 RepID=UPI000575DF17|nr:sugar ABC transporter substrate-binding protein [Thermoanaerobacter sp. YS13]KHO63088.1 ABC transporter substrate-binding protein [Thermoanaerobacter sp. YS13]